MRPPEAIGRAPSRVAGITGPWLEPVSLYALPVLSGAAGLIFETLWLKELSVIFGNTAQAAGATLAIFFLGLATGSRFWDGRKSSRLRALRLYGALELGVAASALLFLGLTTVYRHFYAAIFDGLPSAVVPAAKTFLAAFVLFPPAFFMGGTVPALAEQLPLRADRFDRTRLLYALNTLGAAGGALLAGFFLPPIFGFRGTLGIAVALSASAGVLALVAGSGRPPTPTAYDDSTELEQSFGGLPRRLLLPVAFLSGFLALGMQVLWTRLLAQVLNSSTYAFAAILVTVLAALGAGALMSSAIGGRGMGTLSGLSWAFAVSGVAILGSSAGFLWLTQGLAPIAVGSEWSQYVQSIFVASGILVFVPAAAMGMVLPQLFGSGDGGVRRPAAMLGRLLALNAAGAICGALLTGFVLLDATGTWGSIQLMAAGYLLLSGLAVASARRLAPWRRAVIAAFLGILAIAGLPGARPIVHLGPAESLVAVTEGSGGTVTVVRAGDNLVMRLNNTYVLGDTRSMEVERLQAHLPLLLHPAPGRVFFLGLGTGVTAGAALDHPVKRVVVAELLPEVVDAARRFYGDYVNGLFEDARVRILGDDGRNVLAGQRERYDVIIADLFTPWHAGTGSLYTLEHFRTVRGRLRPGGIFVQWLPLHQMSRREFLIIARTLAAVFPQVTLWRGNYSPELPIVALVGRPDDVPLDQLALARNVGRLGTHGLGNDAAGPDHMAGLFYAGNLVAARRDMEREPLNRDDRPVIEYLSPKLQVETGRRFIGIELDQFIEQLITSLPPERDPVLSLWPERERRYVRAGTDFYRYYLYSARGSADSAAAHLARFRSVVQAASRGPPRQ